MKSQRESGWPVSFIVGGVVSLILYIIVLWTVISWFDSINVKEFPADRIVSASNALIQLDSFMVAGFIVGFFYLWEKVEAEFKSLTRKKSLKPFVTLSFSTLISLTLSSLFAVGAILTTDSRYLLGSISLLVSGLWTVMLNWYTLQSMLRD